ncbi:FMN-binding protein [Amycolatopsis panacis]|uniref:FMN-binding protein n=1 Tax=Amycolatopsis panacis TaxID=2340917 RepID=A0A419HY50_9PSEU|nr:FMN-binding protein [Amycolatopsis panacis]RJQ82101.1 FMN-binding protein [Amycolatopsis panacis]
MRKIALVFAATVSVLVLLFSYRTSTHSGALATAPQNRAPAGSSVPSAPSGTNPPSGTSSTPTGTSGTPTGTYDGGAADTRYGPVQVEITYTAGRITAARTLRTPSESGRDIEINNAAVPTLIQETLQAQSAHIDTVSGATYTSEGYAESLQSAIDAAHG